VVVLRRLEMRFAPSMGNFFSRRNKRGNADLHHICQPRHFTKHVLEVSKTFARKLYKIRMPNYIHTIQATKQRTSIVQHTS
jgi:hypothetical protein